MSAYYETLLGSAIAILNGTCFFPAVQLQVHNVYSKLNYCLDRTENLRLMDEACTCRYSCTTATGWVTSDTGSKFWRPLTLPCPSRAAHCLWIRDRRQVRAKETYSEAKRQFSVGNYDILMSPHIVTCHKTFCTGILNFLNFTPKVSPCYLIFLRKNYVQLINRLGRPAVQLENFS